MDERLHPETRAGNPFAYAGGAREADEVLQAHYASLERLHCCNGGWVSMGCIDDDGEERQVLIRCRRCEEQAKLGRGRENTSR